MIARACEPFRVHVCPSRGYSSYTYIKRVAVDGRFSKVPDAKKIVILDFRDHDPSGIQMTEDLQTRFLRYSDRSIAVKRIALTISQVRKYELIPNPTKIADSRTARYRESFGDKCWELDAIEPQELQEIVRHAIAARIEWSLWDEAKHWEELDREKLIKRFRDAEIKI